MSIHPSTIHNPRPTPHVHIFTRILADHIILYIFCRWWGLENFQNPYQRKGDAGANQAASPDRPHTGGLIPTIANYSQAKNQTLDQRRIRIAERMFRRSSPTNHHQNLRFPWVTHSLFSNILFSSSFSIILLGNASSSASLFQLAHDLHFSLCRD